VCVRVCIFMCVCAQELREGLAKLGAPTTRDEFDTIAHRIDTDGLGKITYAQFARAFKVCIPMCVYVHACMCACVRVCVRACVYARVYISVFTHNCVCCPCMRACVCLFFPRVSALMCVCVCTCVCVCMCAHVNASVHATYTHGL